MVILWRGDGATGGGKGRGMVCTHGGGESSVSVNHPASEASKESAGGGNAERRRESERGAADVIGRDGAYMATESATSAGAGRNDIAIIIK